MKVESHSKLIPREHKNPGILNTKPAVSLVIKYEIYLTSFIFKAIIAQQFPTTLPQKVLKTTPRLAEVTGQVIQRSNEGTKLFTDRSYNMEANFKFFTCTIVQGVY